MRQARRARVQMIRRRVIAGSVALFIGVWSLIAVVLVTGHDPALARKTLTQPATTATKSGSSTGSTSSTPASASTSSTATGSTGSTGSSTGSGSSAPSPVTSSQS